MVPKLTDTKLRPFVEDAHRFARSLQVEMPDYIHEDLCGACAVASAYLTKNLREAGIDARTCIGDGHSFVMVGDWYLDPTCEQFGFEAPWLAKSPPSSSPTWYPHRMFTDLSELVDYMFTASWWWDAEQIEKFVLNRR